MQNQALEALRGCQLTIKPHVNMAPFEESEDIQDFLEAFEGNNEYTEGKKDGMGASLNPVN